MNGRQLTDGQLAAGLRAHLPAQAAAGLRERITAQVAETQQLGRLPYLLGLGDADPIVHRRAVLLVAAAALLAVLSVAAVGAWLRQPEPLPVPRADLSLVTDPDAFVLGARQEYADLPAFRLVFRREEEGQESFDQVYLYDGAVLREGDDGQASLLGPDFTASEQVVAGNPVWVVSSDTAYPEPLKRLAEFVLPAANCPDGWELVEVTAVIIDRSTRHLRCSDLHAWFDLATGLPLQFGTLDFLEFHVEEFEVGPQSAALFVPDGTVMSDEEFTCLTEGVCASAGPAVTTPPQTPIVSPPPANPGVAPADLDAFVAMALAAYEGDDPVEIVVDSDRSAGDGTSWARRFHSDGLGNYRSFNGRTLDAITGGGWLITGGRAYDRDGGRWRDYGPATGPLPGFVAPKLGLRPACGSGWTYLGDDLVLDRPAAHIACGFQEFWIDREWLFVTRAHDHDPLLGDDPGTGLSQVISVTFGPQPPELFAVPSPDDVYNSY